MKRLFTAIMVVIVLDSLCVHVAANVSDLMFAHEQLDVKHYYHVMPV